MQAIRGWLAGRKTYLLSAVIVIATLVLVAMGHLTPTTALMLLVFASAGFPATYRSAIQRHHDELLAELGRVALTGAALAAHNLPAARAEAVQVIADGIVLGQEIQAEVSQANAKVIAISEPEARS